MLKLFGNEAPLRCTKWRSMFLASSASSYFAGRAAARRCSNGGATISGASKPGRTSAASAFGALSATRPTSSLNGRRSNPPAAEEHDPNSVRGLDVAGGSSRHPPCRRPQDFAIHPKGSALGVRANIFYPYQASFWWTRRSLFCQGRARRGRPRARASTPHSDRSAESGGTGRCDPH